jgi:hypothetical protein
VRLKSGLSKFERFRGLRSSFHARPLRASVDFLSVSRITGTHFHLGIVRQDHWSSQPLRSYRTICEGLTTARSSVPEHDLCLQFHRLGEIPLIECGEFRPRSLCSYLVVDLAAAHRPAVIAALVDLNLCLQMRCREGLL